MRLFNKAKDGGSESPVDAYFLFEIKGLASVALLKFNKGGREAFHTHAFDALTWFVKGDLLEEDVSGETYKYKKSIIPKITLKSKNHRVLANEDSYCLTIRGKWDKNWTEYDSKSDTTTVFNWGRSINQKLKGLY